jgi:hypothetical protein
MFVRFRQSTKRLDLSLIESTRRDGKPRHEHVASLGSVSRPPSVSDRVVFWRKLHERLANLSNRIDGKTQGRVLGLVHGRVPMVTPQEQRELQLSNALAEATAWEAVAGICDANAEDSKRLLVSADLTLGAYASAAKAAANAASAAKDKLARLQHGENVGGGLGKPKDIEAVLIEAGLTKADMRRAIRSAEFNEEEFEAILAEKQRRATAGSDWLPRSRRSPSRT